MQSCLPSGDKDDMSFQKYLTEHVLLNELAPVLAGAAARAVASPAVRSVVADAASKKFKQTMAAKYSNKPATMYNYDGPSQQKQQEKKQEQSSDSRHHPHTITNNHYNYAANSNETTNPNKQEPELTPEQKAAQEAAVTPKKDGIVQRDFNRLGKESGMMVNKTISGIPSATSKFGKWLVDTTNKQLSTS